MRKLKNKVCGVNAAHVALDNASCYCCIHCYISVCVLYVIGLWGIVNNAEVPGKMGPMPWLMDRDFYRVYSVNVVGTAKVNNLFLRVH